MAWCNNHSPIGAGSGLRLLISSSSLSAIGCTSASISGFSVSAFAPDRFPNSSLSVVLTLDSGPLTADFPRRQKVSKVRTDTGLSVYLGNGDGTFGPPTHYSGSPSEYHYAVVVGDFNGDSQPDLATVNQ